MLKILILSAVLSIAASEEKDWFKGRWLSAVGYPNRTIPSPMCDWKELSILSSECECGTTAVPTVALVNLNNNDAKAYPVIMFDGINGLQETLERKCECFNEKKEYPLVLRKVNDKYMVMYGRYQRLFSKDKEPNLAFLLVKVVPKLLELREVMAEIDDLKDRSYAFNCEPKDFAD